LRVFLEIKFDYDLPCFLLEDANIIEQLAAMEADRTRRFPPTTPGLAEAMQRHVNAYVEEAAAARSLGEAAMQGADDYHMAAAKARLTAASRAFNAAERHFREICR
jgi:hypothetical protein